MFCNHNDYFINSSTVIFNAFAIFAMTKTGDFLIALL